MFVARQQRKLKFPRDICKKNLNERSSAGQVAVSQIILGAIRSHTIPSTTNICRSPRVAIVISPCMLHWMPSISALHPLLPPTNPPTHSTPEARWLCVCGGSEKERKKRRGWNCSIVCYSSAQAPMEHWESGMSVPLADFSTGWGLFDWSWMLRTEHIVELKGRPVRIEIGFLVGFFFQFIVFRHARSCIFPKNLKKCCMWNASSVNLLGNKTRWTTRRCVFNAQMEFLPTLKLIHWMLDAELWIFIHLSKCLNLRYISV